jgi:parallel beta-helix repeat protein
MTRTARRGLGLLVVSLLCAMLAASAAQARTIKVVANGSTESIQKAIDEAAPFDVVKVPAGTYKGPTVKVEKDDLTIKGSRSAIIDASGNTYGITVGQKLTFDPGPTCPAYTVSDFKISGLTVKEADDTGIFLFGVDGFQVLGGSYLNNEEYGIFPRCSREGLIEKNSGGGGDDATIYVGVDDGVRVERNKMTNGELGIELESTDNTIVRKNKVSGNTAGIFVIVLPGLPKSSTENAVIEENNVTANNRPNPFPEVCKNEEPENPPGCTVELEDDLQLLPSGTGILNVGGHHVTISHNNATGNGTLGVGVVENPFGFGSSNFTTITNNKIKNNGHSPDPRAGGNADIIYEDNPANGSCLASNVFKTALMPFGEPPVCT